MATSASAPTAAIPVPSPAPVLPPAVAPLGPRLTPLVASVGLPALRDKAANGSSLLLADAGGRHTVVISTLSLVLIVVLIVLLI